MGIGPEQENTGLFHVEAGSVRSEKYVSRYMLQSIIGPPMRSSSLRRHTRGNG